MKTTSIRELKHNMSTVLSWVNEGETVEVRRRRDLVAVLSPPRRKRPAKPDFTARLRAIYGTKAVRTTGTELLAEDRGAT